MRGHCARWLVAILALLLAPAAVYAHSSREVRASNLADPSDGNGVSGELLAQRLVIYSDTTINAIEVALASTLFTPSPAITPTLSPTSSPTPTLSPTSSIMPSVRSHQDRQAVSSVTPSSSPGPCDEVDSAVWPPDPAKDLGDGGRHGQEILVQRSTWIIAVEVEFNMATIGQGEAPLIEMWLDDGGPSRTFNVSVPVRPGTDLQGPYMLPAPFELLPNNVLSTTLLKLHHRAKIRQQPYSVGNGGINLAGGLVLNAAGAITGGTNENLGLDLSLPHAILVSLALELGLYLPHALSVDLTIDKLLAYGHPFELFDALSIAVSLGLCFDHSLPHALPIYLAVGKQLTYGLLFVLIDALTLAISIANGHAFHVPLGFGILFALAFALALAHFSFMDSFELSLAFGLCLGCGVAHTHCISLHHSAHGIPIAIGHAINEPFPLGIALGVLSGVSFGHCRPYGFTDANADSNVVSHKLRVALGLSLGSARVAISLAHIVVIALLCGHTLDHDIAVAVAVGVSHLVGFAYGIGIFLAHAITFAIKDCLGHSVGLTNELSISFPIAFIFFLIDLTDSISLALEHSVALIFTLEIKFAFTVTVGLALLNSFAVAISEHAHPYGVVLAIDICYALAYKLNHAHALVVSLLQPIADIELLSIAHSDKHAPAIGLVVPAQALSGGATFSNGQPAAVIVTVTSAELSGDVGVTRCVGNAVVGITSSVDFSYHLRIVTTTNSNDSVDADGGSGNAITPPRTVGYIIHHATGVVIAQYDLTAAMPTVAGAATAAFTRVTARISQAVALDSTSLYWLPVCFSQADGGRRQATTGYSVGLAGAIDNSTDGGARLMMATCNGGPTCQPAMQAGSLATSMVESSANGEDGGGGSGDVDSVVIIAAAVAVPVMVVLVAIVAIAIVVWRAKGGLHQQAPVPRRNSVEHQRGRKTTLERTVKELHSNQLFKPETSRNQHYQNNKETWMTDDYYAL